MNLGRAVRERGVNAFEHTSPMWAPAVIFLVSCSRSSLSLTGRPLGAIVEDDAPPEAWRYRGLGDGVVADDEGVAMTAERVARRVVVVADVVTGVQVDVEDEGRGAGQCLGRRGRVTGRDADGHTAARARRVEG